MRVELDLGFSSLFVLVACSVLPVIGLVLRSKWRRSVTRKEEIRRLIVVASQEAARAELEASAGYGAFAYVNDSDQARVFDEGYDDTRKAAQTGGNFCAVCYVPTTRRCSRCKAVRYCSDECQFTHWRLGHKDECCPPVTKSGSGDQPSNHERSIRDSSKLVDKKKLLSKSANLSPDDTPLFDSSEAPKVKHSNVVVDINAVSSSESTEFSGFSASGTSNESSDDVSICDSVGSNDSGNSDEHLMFDLANDKSRTISRENVVDQAKTISPKFASLVDDVARSSCMSDSNESKPIYSARQAQCKSKSSSVSANGSMQDSPAVELAANSSGFWEADGIKDNNSSPCSLNNSFNSSGNNIRETEPLHAPIREEKGYTKILLGKEDRRNTLSPLSLKRERIGHARSGSNLRSESSRPLEAPSSVSVSANITSSSQKDAPSIDAVSTSATAVGKSKGCLLDHKASSRLADGVTTREVSSESAGISENVGRHSDIAGRYSDKGLFTYELFVKLYTWKEVELRPCGLINCGNSCYANAVLQCMAFTPPLTAYFLQGLHSKNCANKDWCFMCEFESLILKAKKGESPVSPVRIVSRLENIGSLLRNGREEDAHEFLRYAIGAMESICHIESRISLSSCEEDTTLVGLTFGGYLRSKIRCTKCLGKFECQERMMDLAVEIDGDTRTLEEALKRFTLSETLDGENKYHCSRCGSYVRAKKKLTILEAPNVLTIALKRYQMGKFGKLNKSIQYPEILNLAPYVSGTSDKLPIYRLYGVIVHLDAMNASYSGHYVCYVKNPQNKWFKIDDSKVMPVDLETVLKVGAYMLLYSRCSPRAPGSIRNHIISSDPKPKPVPSRILSNMPSLKPYGSSLYDDLRPNLVPSVGLSCLETPYSRFQRLRKMLEEDTPSDSSSLFSSNSDEGSSSSDGTRESTCATEDFSEYLFGGWSSSLRNSSDSESSSSSIPSSSSSSPMASSSQKRSQGFPETTEPRVDNRADTSFLHHDRSSNGRSLLGSGSCVSNRRETKSERFVHAAGGFDGVKSGRRSFMVGERPEKDP